MNKFLDIIIPRFLTEDVACVWVPFPNEEWKDYPELQGYYDIVCSMADVYPEEEFDGIATVQTFNLFGLALFPKQVGEIKPWKNPHDGNLKV